MKPLIELRFNRIDDLVESLKVSIVETQPPRELPDAFYGIEFGTVGRQIVQSEGGLVFRPPLLV